MTPPQQLYERLVAGGVAGAVSRTVVAPLERYVLLSRAAFACHSEPQKQKPALQNAVSWAVIALPERRAPLQGVVPC